MEQCVTLAHSMEKEHFVSFAALISFDRVQLVKLYPEQEPAVRFAGVRPAGGLLRMRRLPSGRFFHAAVCCRIHWRGEGA